VLIAAAARRADFHHRGRRAGAGAVYVICYLAMGVPAVAAGFLVVHGGVLLPTTREYGVAVMAPAAVALLGVIRPARRTEAGVLEQVDVDELVGAR
jgi:hypothetical protein